MKSVSATKPALTRREINRMPPKSDVPDALLDTLSEAFLRREQYDRFHRIRTLAASGSAVERKAVSALSGRLVSE
jgi:hypothetical protein